MYDLDFAKKGTIAATTDLVAAGYDGVNYLQDKMRGIATLAVDVRGTFVATLAFEGTVDGTNWLAVTAIPNGGGAGVTSVTGTGLWFLPATAYRNFRVRCSAYTSGTATVTLAGAVASKQGAEPIVATASPQTGTPTATQPSVADSTSVSALAANASRKYLMIQNNTAANIALSLAGDTLTGIVPSATNKCMVLVAGASYEAPAHYIPTGAITVYQTSGGTVRTISVVEG